jgi:hypothetical protein
VGKEEFDVSMGYACFLTVWSSLSMRFFPPSRSF